MLNRAAWNLVGGCVALSVAACAAHTSDTSDVCDNGGAAMPDSGVSGNTASDGGTSGWAPPPDGGTTAPPSRDASGGDSAVPPTHPTSDASADAGSDTGPTNPAADAGKPVVTGDAAAGFIFSPYKDTGINMNWNTNVISTSVSGAAASLASDLVAHGGKAITLAFATGECGSENWAGVAGAAMATANVAQFTAAGANYIVSTGGAAGSFTCGTDTGMSTFIERWASPQLLGVDFDIEAGQSAAVISALITRIQVAHTSYPNLRFSLTLATLAPSASGATTASSLGAAAVDGFNSYGDDALAAVQTTFGFAGTAATWPSYLTVDLMTMDYGTASSDLCVAVSGVCEMGQSAIQAAYDLHDKWGVPYSNIELTPMLGGNDNQAELFTLADVDTVSAFAISQGLAGVHYWSYDRDLDCAVGSASSTCNSMGAGYAGSYGYLKRFVADGL